MSARGVDVHEETLLFLLSRQSEMSAIFARFSPRERKVFVIMLQVAISSEETTLPYMPRLRGGDAHNTGACAGEERDEIRWRAPHRAKRTHTLGFSVSRLTRKRAYA